MDDGKASGLTVNLDGTITMWVYWSMDKEPTVVIYDTSINT